MMQWIGAAEAFMRQLLHIEANAILGAIALPPTKPHAHKSPRTRRLVTFHPDRPEAWRVSFRCNVEQTRPAGMPQRRPARTPSLHTPTVYDAWPLALRSEALLRVFNDPIPYARRLARRLHAHPARTPRTAPEKLQRIVGGAEHWEEVETLRRGVAAPRARDDSG